MTENGEMNVEELEQKIASPPVAPHGKKELYAVFTMPYKIIDLALSEWNSLVKTISSGNNVILLTCVLLYTSIIFSLPFGAVLGIDRFWRVALLFLGSLGICFPSLQIFSAYVGCRMNTRQSLALGLVITCVAALFSFGFFPILWFLNETMEQSSQITSRTIGVVLLAVSLLAGIGHLYRCLYRIQNLVASYRILIFFWHILFVFITFRMARSLGLL